MSAKILVVDDDASVRNLLKKYLSEKGFSVVVTDNGSEALLLAKESRPDLILTDAQMPGLDGHALCRVLKKGESRRIPIILMSGAMTQDKHVLSGFEGGADDYVMKPLSLPVLAARIRAVLERGGAPSGTGRRVKMGGLRLDPDGRTAAVDGKPLSLTRKEFDLLSTLIEKAGQVLSVNYLLETVWGYDPADYNDPATVEVHVSHLRRKLGSKLGKRIINVLGHGYKFESPPA